MLYDCVVFHCLSVCLSVSTLFVVNDSIWKWYLNRKNQLTCGWIQELSTIEDERQLDYLIRLLKLLKYKSISTNSMLMMMMMLLMLLVNNAHVCCKKMDNTAWVVVLHLRNNSVPVYSKMDNTAWGALLYLRHYHQHHAQIARNYQSLGGVLESTPKPCWCT